MNTLKSYVATIVAAFMVLSQLYIPSFNAYAGNKEKPKKVEDPYMQYSDEQFIQIAEKDFQLSIRNAISEGVIKTEEDFFKKLAQETKTEPLSDKSKGALKKRGVNTNPSYYIGSTRAAKLNDYLKELDGSSLDTVKPTSNLDSLVNSYKNFRKNRKLEPSSSAKDYLNLAVLITHSLVLLEAKAETSSQRISSSRDASTVSPTNSRTGVATRYQATGVTVNTSTSSSSSSSGSTSSRRYTDAELDEMEDIYTQASVADTWDKTLASEAKGMKSFTHAINQKRAEAMMYLLFGVVLLAIGAYNVIEGQKKMNDYCNPAQSAADLPPGTKINGVDVQKNPQDEVDRLKKERADAIQENVNLNNSVSTKNPDASPGDINAQSQEVIDRVGKKFDARIEAAQKEVDNNKSAQDYINNYKKNSSDNIAKSSPPCIPGMNTNLAICDAACRYVANDAEGSSQRMIGGIMVLGGAALIIYSMNKFGDVATMEDEKDEQDNKNKAIDEARSNLLDREQAKVEAQKKILNYRIRSRQLSESAAANNSSR